MSRLYPAMVVFAATCTLAPFSDAQIVPVPGTGCAGPPPLTVLGGPPVPGAVLTLRCPPPPCCLPGAPSVVFLGVCQAPPIPLGPLGIPECFGPCFLGCPPLALIPPGVPLPPLPAVIGGTFCLQCVCIGADPVIPGPCICLSEKVNVTIQGPPPPVPTITAVSTTTPTAGGVITINGTGFGRNGCCTPGFFPLGPPQSGQVQLQVANIPQLGNPFELEVANFTDFVGLGQGGQPFTPVPGVGIPANTIGGVGNIPIGTQAGQGITMVINRPASPATQLPVTIDGQGRICIDFSGTSWNGNEKLEVELHFDIVGTANPTHCDFFSTVVCFTAAGTAQQCAATAGIWISLQLAIDPNCAGISVLVQGDVVYLLAPGGGTFTNLHPFSHCAIL